MDSAHHAMKWLELQETLIYPTASSFFKNEEGTVVDNHDDMKSPIREVGWYKSEEHIMICIQMESTIMICMLVSNSNLKSVMLFPPFELAGFLSLDSLVVYHLWISQMNSFLLLNWRGFCV